MEFRASHRFAPISARKARPVVDMVRGRPVNQALEMLTVTNKRASVMALKVVKAALASAEDREDVEVDLNRLFVARAWVDEAPDLPGFRFVPGPRGRFMPIVVRRSHIQVRLSEAEEDLTRRKERKKKKGRQSPKKTAKAVSAAAGESDSQDSSENQESSSS